MYNPTMTAVELLKILENIPDDYAKRSTLASFLTLAHAAGKEEGRIEGQRAGRRQAEYDRYE